MALCHASDVAVLLDFSSRHVVEGLLRLHCIAYLTLT